MSKPRPWDQAASGRIHLMWIPLGFLAAILAFDVLVWRFGVDSRPGFGVNPEPKDTPRRAI